MNKESRIVNMDPKPLNSLFNIHNSEPEGMPGILLVDMNSFFASVEQQANPFYRGKPLGVCASLHGTSCIIAASKEAKQLGIKTGTLIYQARKICPQIILTEADPDKYRNVNKGLNKILSEYTDQIEAYSIDESFMDLRGSGSDPLKTAVKIKQRIQKELGEWLTCSIGIGPNKFIAKMASDLKKPDGLTIIWRDSLREVYRGVKLTDLWGVARGWQRRLQALGITTPLQVLDYPVGNLIAVFGKPGFYLWQRICGLEEDSVRSEEDAPKSFGHSWVLNFRTADKSRLGAVVMRLAEKAARRMRKEGFEAHGIYLSITLVDGSYFHVSKKLKFAVSSGMEYFDLSQELWKKWKLNKEAFHIAVGFTNLKPLVNQLALFDDRKDRIKNALDAVNDKYGEFTLRSGLLVKTSDYAPDAIAFGK